MIPRVCGTRIVSAGWSLVAVGIDHCRGAGGYLEKSLESESGLAPLY